MKYAGLDIGTTTISGVLLDAERGTCLNAITHPNSAHNPKNKAWQDPEEVYRICLKILAQLSEGFGQPDAVGLTGQMHGVLYVDARGEAASPLFSWQDSQGDLPYRAGRTYAEDLTDLTGYPMATGFGLTTHYYHLQQNQVPMEAASLATIPDYIAMRLCGLAEPITHLSMAHSLGLFNLAGGHYDLEALQAAGISQGILPPVASGEAIVGRTGEGIPVAIAIGDNQASFLGSVQPGSDVLLNIGTGSQISVLSPAILDLPPLETRPYLGGEYLLVGSALCGGSAYNLLRDFFNQVLRELGGVVPQDLYAHMAAQGEKAYGECHPLAVDTRFMGTRTDPNIRGAIKAIGTDNFTPGSLVAGFLAGMVGELKGFYDRLPEDLRVSEGITGSGNAIRRNPLLRRMVVDQFGKPLSIPEDREEAAMGAARHAGRLLHI